MKLHFFLQRTYAIVRKEFKEMLQDPVTTSMVLLIPLIQIILFAYTINNDPKHLPTVVVSEDSSDISRNIISDLQLSGYFDVLPGIHSLEQAEHLFKSGKAQFAIQIPTDFTKKLIHGSRPQLLIEADSTDPAAVGYALSSFNELSFLFAKHFTGPLEYLSPGVSPIDIIVHSKYNPNRITQYNIVPGLLSAVLSLTLVLVTALAVVRERESGTMEVLLTYPLRPSEIIIGKIIPYIILAYSQALLILFMSYFVFNIPIKGSLFLLLTSCFPFILANLALGITFSAVTNNQMQAAQATSFYFLPSILFSGFMFPFYGLPGWGQFLGYFLPSTHFLIIVRGIMLKGSTFFDIYPNLIAIMVLFLGYLFFAITRFRQTLD
jgi:ABC-2 type transport system permease protein